MSLTVCASSTDVDLSTTGMLKQLLGTSSTGQDVLLSALIRSASRYVENYIGTPLTLQSYSESVAGFGRLQLMLDRTPVRAIDRILDATDSGQASQIYTSEYAVDSADAGVITRQQGWDWTPLLEGRCFDASVPLSLTPLAGQELKPFLVDYRAGYTYNGVTTSSPNWSTEKGTTSTGRTLPEDLELAVLFRAQELYEGGQGVASESLGDLSVNYRSLGTDAEGQQITRVTEILDRYRRFA
jgi:hypothetical protein